jgi:DNA-binding NarL/FixJ family response regulator
VATGGSVIDPKVVESLVTVGSGPRAGELEELTRRERDVLGEMAQGRSNSAIAAALTVSERAVQKHINSIFTKLGLSGEQDVSHRVKAVLLYLHQGA